MNYSLSSPLTGSVPATSSPCSSPIAKRRKTLTTTTTKNENISNDPIAFSGQTDARITALLQSRDPLMATFQTTMRVGQVIFEAWEGGDRDEGRCNFQNRQRFVNYVVGFVMRIGPSVVTLLHGLIYTLRLRSAYPRARGESGCAHRLFVVALLVAAKYCGDPRLLVDPSYSTWSALSGVFGAEELERMEKEFLCFLKGNLGVRLGDLEEVIEKYFLEAASVDRVVPGSIDLFLQICIERKRLLRSLNPRDGDAICPSE